MKVNIFTYVVMATLLAAAPLTEAKTLPIYNVEHHATPMVEEKLTIKQVRARIMNAASTRRWHCKDSGKNQMVCAIDVRQRHQAKVEIQYSRDGFSIHNLYSKNLNYKNGKIHRNYNKWIKTLEASIAKTLNDF